jgi:hypothetical protein
VVPLPATDFTVTSTFVDAPCFTKIEGTETESSPAVAVIGTEMGFQVSP